MAVFKYMITAIIAAVAVGAGVAHFNADAGPEAGQPAFIVDRKGERWDVTQALTLGFKPQGFQFGIGRDAIRPLDGSRLEKPTVEMAGRVRVIGVENGSDAHAYVVRRLTLHEIANTELGQTPIAAAY